jgi:aminopeptidase N
MAWWNDLWLNESFASYMGVLSEVEATRFTEGWAIFATFEKPWALQQDQLPTTHPIVADIPDVQAVHLNFDGITYAKGASVLKQLVSWVGRERFFDAMKVYFSRHEFGNAELSDFLAVLEEASGRDLDAWAKEWLQASGVNVVAPRYEERDGRFERFHLVQHEPPTGGPLRRHRIAVGLYDDEGGRLVRRRLVELDLVGGATEVAELQGEPVPALVVVNDDDLTFAKVRFDPGSITTLRERLGDVDDSVARAVCWTACWDMTRDAELPAREFLEVALRHGPREAEVGSLERVLGQARAALHLYGDPANRASAADWFAEVALGEARGAEPGSERQLAWIRGFAAAARSDPHVAMLRGLLTGSEGIDGVEVDTELRWLMVESLAASGVADADTIIGAELGRDPTDMGIRHAAAARAARPTVEAKADAWRSVLEDRSLTLAHVNAIMHGFQQPGQESVLEAYVVPYLDSLPGVWEDRDLEFALDFGQQMFPQWIVSTETIERVDRVLTRDLPGPIRRMLLEGRDRLHRALRARDVDRQSAGR